MNNYHHPKHDPATVLKHTLAVIVIISAVLAFIYRRELTLPALLCYTPKNLYLAFGIMLLAFALKSITVVMVIKVLYIASGIIFPLPIAIITNLLGTAIAMTIPYLFARFSLRDTATALFRKYPRLKRAFLVPAKSDFRFAFLIRTIIIFPFDAVSILLGALKLPYLPYLLGGLLGVLPSLIVTTVLGLSAEDPSSTAFIVSAAVFILISAAAIIAYCIWEKRLPPEDVSSDKRNNSIDRGV